MALIIETGTIVSNANSYGDLAGLRAFATARGIDLVPAADADLDVHMIKAMDFIEAKRARFKGIKATATQSTQWPRIGVEIDDYALESNKIPRELIYCQFFLALESYLGNDLLPTRLPSDKGLLTGSDVGGAIKKTFEYPDKIVNPVFTKAMSVLSPLMNASNRVYRS